MVIVDYQPLRDYDKDDSSRLLLWSLRRFCMKNLKKVLTVLGLGCLGSNMAMAKDSLWLLCDNSSYALNVFEHRSNGGDGRVTDLVFLFGGHTLQGSLKDTESGPLFLAQKAGNKTLSSIRGTISIDFTTQKVNLKGKFRLQGDTLTLNETLLCKELGNP